MRDFKVIVTLGPAILDEDKIKKINSYGQCIYRINGAHTDEKQVGDIVSQVKSILPAAKIMIDLPGNKIRTENLSEPIRLIKGESFVIYDYEINYPEFCRILKRGDIIYANDSVFTFKVIETSKSKIKLLSYSDGLLISNKGLHVRGIHKNIPFIFKKDIKLLEAALSNNLDFLNLSFVRTAEDIQEVKKLLKGRDINIIAKIETLSAVNNLKTIFKEVGSVLIDRGDLSTEIDMLNLGRVQDSIIKAGIKSKKNVYLATQFLKNMEKKPIPLISEVIELSRCVATGIAGIQLSEETAIGAHPVECVKLVFDAYKNRFNR